jgi:hypothetical protein
MPFAKGQAYFRLIERLYTHPLPDSTLPQHTPLLLCTMERVLEQRIFTYCHHSIANLDSQKLPDDRRLVRQRLDQNVK